MEYIALFVLGVAAWAQFARVRCAFRDLLDAGLTRSILEGRVYSLAVLALLYGMALGITIAKLGG